MQMRIPAGKAPILPPKVKKEEEKKHSLWNSLLENLSIPFLQTRDEGKLKPQAAQATLIETLDFMQEIQLLVVVKRSTYIGPERYQ